MGQVFQGLLNALGWFLARVYDLIPNYGVAVIVLTLFIRVLLLPLAVKQIRSMQAMQAIQPKIKELQRRHKGDRQKLNEEMMKLYQERGVSPFGGCLPLLAQFPVLIALFAVLNFPKGLTHIPHSNANPVVGVPQDSRLYVDIIHQKTNFLGVNLVCSPREAGQQVKLSPQTLKAFPDLKAGPKTLNCGKDAPVRIPYYLLLALMVGTTYYQQRQMQRASPGGSQQQQQQMLARIMPIFFGFIGFGFPTGLIIYWTTTNLVQIAQQHYMFVRKGEQGDTDEVPPVQAKSGGLWMNLRGRLMAAAGGADGRKPADGSPRRSANRPPPRARPPGGSAGGRPRSSGTKPTGGGTSSKGSQQPPKGSQQPSKGSQQPSKGSQPSKGGQSPGGRDGRDRKKRRKR